MGIIAHDERRRAVAAIEAAEGQVDALAGQRVAEADDGVLVVVADGLADGVAQGDIGGAAGRVAGIRDGVGAGGEPRFQGFQA